MLHHLSFWILVVVAVPIFWLLPARFRYGFLGVASGAYLAEHDKWSVLGLVVWLVVFYRLAPLVRPGSPRNRQVALGLVLAIVGFLTYFKYIPPLVEALVGNTPTASLIIPLGISYYTFKLIHYVLETMRGSLPEHSFQQFLCYMLLFSAFTAGPIQRFDHFLGNLEPRWQASSAVEGLTRIVHGLIKKFVLAAPLANKLFDGHFRTDNVLDPSISPWMTWLLLGGLYAYIYLDFSAYTDIAIGCSRLFGIRIMENFNFPVIAANIRDYWRRWHMTLSGWCQSYIYMPVLGLYRKPFLSLYLTFLVMGLWHAGTTARIGWGLYHATGVAIFTVWNRYRRQRGWKLFDHIALRPVAIGVTQLFVCGSMAFLLFESDGGIADPLRVLCKLFFIPT